jgi:hypothetical protein
VQESNGNTGGDTKYVRAYVIQVTVHRKMKINFLICLLEPNYVTNCVSLFESIKII